MNNVLDNPLVGSIYDKISTFNYLLIPCEFEDVSMFVYQLTDICEVKLCRKIALDVLDILSNANLVIYDYGYKALPSL